MIANLQMVESQMTDVSDVGSTQEEEDEDESVGIHQQEESVLPQQHEGSVLPQQQDELVGPHQDEQIGPQQQSKKRGKRRIITLTEEQKEDVIEFLIRNEGLYNKKKDLCQQPHKKNELWKQQGLEMGIDWKDIFTWYETQRRRLGRLKTLACKSGSGSLVDSWKESDIEFWQRWRFLRPHINTQSQEPVVSIRDRLASTTAPSLNQEDDSFQVAQGSEDRPDVQSETRDCSRQMTPETPVSCSPSDRRNSTQSSNQIIDALLASSERHNQLINLSESILKSQQVQSGVRQDRHHFNLWCGSVLQELPQDLYEQCESESFRLLTHYRKLALNRPPEWNTATPQPRFQPPRFTNQSNWQPGPSSWIQNPPAANSVWASQSCEYMTQYNQQAHQLQHPMINPPDADGCVSD